jgi:hypothetical protein
MNERLARENRDSEIGRDIWQKRVANGFKCAGLTKDGTRCRNLVESDGLKCWVHSDNRR